MLSCVSSSSQAPQLANSDRGPSLTSRIQNGSIGISTYGTSVLPREKNSYLEEATPVTIIRHSFSDKNAGFFANMARRMKGSTASLKVLLSDHSASIVLISSSRVLR